MLLLVERIVFQSFEDLTERVEELFETPLLLIPFEEFT